MAEEASTGGLKKFSYDKAEPAKLDEERKSAIASGYEQYYERKALERRNRIIILVVAGLIVLGTLGYFLLR